MLLNRSCRVEIRSVIISLKAPNQIVHWFGAFFKPRSFFMKKSLVALAVLAASSASFAQSNVTIYGIVDAWFGVNKAVPATGGAPVSITKLDSGGVDGDRWGLKGSEDLGGGLKADFNLEQGFAVDTGAGGPGFNRYAAVGFSGGFGTVKIGKFSTAYDMVENGANGVFNSALSAEANTFKSGNYNWNPSNGIYYATPDMGGFGAAVSYALGENKTAAHDSGNVSSFNLSYGQGPLSVSAGYQSEKLYGDSTANKVGQINANYDFTVAKLQLAYGTSDVTTTVETKTSEYQIGVTAPLSGAVSVAANFAYSKDDDNALTTGVKRNGIGLGATYTLSKRTFLYGGYRAETAKQDGAANVETSLFAVGVHHTF
jgi:predicted porin